MKRKLYDKLLEWKNCERRKPLILEGARQVGKTWLMKEFGKNEYENCAYINCENEPLAKSLFEQDFDIERILRQVQAIAQVNVKPSKTLIIFDEIQEAPRGLTSLKYFYEKAPEYHVIVAGSFLGIALHHGTSFPVGKVDRLTLYPMDFEEFAWAAGKTMLAELLPTGDAEMINTLAPMFEELLRQYYFVGGMPEVVKTYFETSDLKTVRQLQGNIIAAYRSDISKHASKEDTTRILQVLDSIPSQLVKENKKFMFNVIKRGARAREFEVAIQWLIDCGILYKVNRVSAVKMPLKFYEDISAFKLFLLDCGLFGCLCNAPASQILIGRNVFSEYKGAFTELYVLQQLQTADVGIFYWSSPTADAELDFVVQDEERILPIEVKAETNLRARTLRSFINRHSDLHGYRLSLSPYEEQDWVTNIPLYALCLLRKNNQADKH